MGKGFESFSPSEGNNPEARLAPENLERVFNLISSDSDKHLSSILFFAVRDTFPQGELLNISDVEKLYEHFPTFQKFRDEMGGMGLAMFFTKIKTVNGIDRSAAYQRAAENFVELVYPGEMENEMKRHAKI